MIFHFVRPLFSTFLSCLFLGVAVPILVLPFRHTHLLFLGLAFLNGLALRFLIVIGYGIDHWFMIIPLLCRYEIIIFEYISLDLN